MMKSQPCCFLGMKVGMGKYYTLIKRLDAGSFGKVFLGINEQTNANRAI